MFRSMRRSAQTLTKEQCIDILKKRTSGVLSLLGDNGYPYGVPMSFVYVDGKLLFHSALSGHKIDALQRCKKSSFTVIDADEVIAHKLTSAYRSVICFGKITLLEAQAKEQALRALANKYSSDFPEEIEREMREDKDRTAVLAFEVEHMSGKRGSETALT